MPELPAALEPVRLLGHGSMASVYLARDTTLKRLVAVKVLRAELGRDEVCRHRFEREAQAVARLAHPSIPQVYSVARLADDTPCIVMEYVQGDNLADWLQSRPAPGVDEAVNILRQLAGALAVAHERNIVHRDVKPANVLIDAETGRICLTDFGIAALVETGSEIVTRLTRADERLGDPAYMSPEQLRGDPVTRRSDIYALGVIGYELLTGQGPYAHLDSRDVAGLHLRAAPADLAERRPELPAALGALLRRCLAKRPEHRPRAGEVLAALARDASDDAADGAGPFASFLAELQQRKVYRAGVAYAAFTFLVLQVADLVLPALGAPESLYRAVVVASLAGFPVSIALAWLFDLQHGRLVRATDDEDALRGTAKLKARRLLKWLGLAASVLLAAALAWLLLAGT